nr:hypothetical protein [uncultured Methanoregula sp.]
MGKLLRAGKNAVLVIMAIAIICVVSVFGFMAYASIFLSHQSFADAFPFKETDLTPEGKTFNTNNSEIVTLSDPDFVRYPILKELVNNPNGGHHIIFNREQYRNRLQIEDFRNKYSSNRSITRYVWWNGTYYQIVIGQE